MIKCGTTSDNTVRGANVWDADELLVTAGADKKPKPKPKKPKK